MARTSMILRKCFLGGVLRILLTTYREKARIPAWCDRILRKGNNLKQIEYAMAPLRFSDHRPVYATFECTVQSIDEQRKNELSRSLYERRKQDITHATAKGNEKMHEDHAGYLSIAAGLPPASSDRRKWWLDHSLPARSHIQPPQSNVMLNPLRPANPFTATTEPDWIAAGRPRKPGGSERRIRTPPKLPAPRTIQNSPRPPDRELEASSTISTPNLFNEELASPTLASPLRSPTTSSVRRKPAPPVPKKPLLLSNPGREPKIHPRSDDSQHAEDFMTGIDCDAFVPALAPRNGSGTAISQAGRSTSTAAHNDRPPPPSSFKSRTLLTSRRGGDKDSGRETLLDQDDEGAETIPSLQPLRPH
ncbi:MAG: hypothetical protein Q9178_006340 [Gyalolechia marmorata]